jgi:hypothetical protein
LLPAADAILIANQFGEDLGPEHGATATGSIYGAGTEIKGVWGIPGGSQSTTLDLAYIVAPEGLTLDQLKYSIDLARTEGGTAFLRNGFALPEMPVITPHDPYTVTGQPQPQTPGTAIETVVREDGSVAREEVPIPGWQPGDPWGSLLIKPPAEAETTPSVIVTTQYDSLQDYLAKNGNWTANIGHLILTTDDPTSTLVGTIGEDYLGRGILSATWNSDGTIQLVEYDSLQSGVTGIATIDASGDHGTSAAWLRGYTGAAGVPYGNIDYFAYDSNSNLAYTMLSDGGASFEAVPEPSAIIITLAGIALWFRCRKN